VHLIYRQNTLPVEQPHSVPLQFLSETGVVGALLGLGALSLLLVAAGRSARREAGTPGERGMAMALLAGGVAYAVHSLYDWDWNIPAVTIPALIFIGGLAGSSRGADGSADRASLHPPASLGTRVFLMTAATVWLSLFALSALLPSLAASRANGALIHASSSTARALDAAQSEARQASSLDPLSDTGLRAEASIALHRGQVTRARYDLERALLREPSDELAWNELSEVDFFLGDRSAARLAARRVVELDPRGPEAQALRRSRLVSAGS
jgi:tetratricopeptide (TPR) repeat protein